MTIGVVANSAWNIVNFRRNLIVSLIERNYSVYIIAPYEEEYKLIVESLGCFFVPIELDNKGTNPIKDIQFMRSLYNLYSNIKFDIVLHFTVKPNIYGSFASYLASIPCVNNVTGLGTVFLHDNIKTNIAKYLYRIAFKIPKHIFFQNNDDRNLFFGERFISQTNSVEVIPGSGIDLDYFKAEKVFRKNAVFTFLMVARLLYDKGTIEYVEAAKELKKNGLNVKFQILGHIETNEGLGVSKEELQSWVNNSLIEYLGTTNDVRPFINKADCVVLPSYREGTPRSLLEAANMKKPIIATNVPGCKEVVIEGYNGYLCEAKSGKSLADKMRKMLSLGNTELKEKGENGRKLVEAKFDQKIVSEAYLHQIRKIEAQKKLLK